MSTTKTGKGFEELAAAPYQADAPARSSAPQSITLAPEHQRWADQAVAEGRFETASDAITFALDHFLPGMPDEDDDWMIPLIEESLNDPRPGIPIEEFQKELEQRLARLASRT